MWEKYRLLISKLRQPWWLLLAYLGVFSIMALTVFNVVASVAKDESPSTTAIEHRIRIEVLESKLSTTEANLLALVGVINRVAAAVDRIQPPSLGHLATKSELELLRRELTRITNMYNSFSDASDIKFNEVRRSIGEQEKITEMLEERLTAHTDNTTIHK